MKNNKKGFTLAEMLIVVAIIGVLISILIPTFSSQIEKAKEHADAANIRSAISSASISMQLNGVNTAKVVTITQTELGWDYVSEIAGVSTVSSSESNLGGKRNMITKAVKNDRALQANKLYYVMVYTDGTIRTCEGLPGSQIGGTWYDINGVQIGMSHKAQDV